MISLFKFCAKIEKAKNILFIWKKCSIIENTGDKIMAFCNFSSEWVQSNSINIDNAFFNEFMPNAPENCVKVYLLGLYKCNNPLSLDNNIESFCRILNMSSEDIISCFLYWQELGLVQTINVSPLEVRYLPIKNGSGKLKKFNKDKYKAFNIKAQEIKANLITPMEFQEYYYIIESYHVEPEALLMIMQYCVNLKGNNVNYSYITTVAKNWAYEGILTCEDVEERLKEQEKSSSDVCLVLKELGLKRNPTNEEYQLYLDWVKELEMPLEIIMFLAKKQGKNNGGMSKLNNTIEKCYNLKLYSIKEINDYFENLTLLKDTAKAICKNLGVRYENLENVIDTYIVPWNSYGFDNETLIKIANFCFTSSVRTLEGMNSKVQQLFKKGLLTVDSIENHINALLENDEQINDILTRLCIDRQVNALDRQLYKTWVYDWNVSKVLLDFAIEESRGKYLPMQYMTKLISSYHSKNITTVEEAKKVQVAGQNTPAPSTKKPVAREYSAKQLNSLFDDIHEIEV